MARDIPSKAASCADYDSAEDEEVAGTRKQANVAAKRTPSQSSGLGKDKSGLATDKPSTPSSPLPLPHPAASSPLQHDLASDSGYFSRTQATVVSADSGTSGSGINPKSVADNAAASGAGRRRAATQLDAGRGEQLAAAKSSKPSVSRSSSQKSGSSKGKKYRQCTDPDCVECKRGRKSKTASPNKSAAKSPAKALPTSKPSGSREPATRPQPESSNPSAAQSRPRLRSNTSGARPRSMYDHPAGPMVIPGAGPPVAYYNRGAYPYEGQPPRPGYLTATGHIMFPERPGMPRVTTDSATVSARRPRPHSMMSSPLVTYDANAGPKVSARRTTKTTPYFGNDDDGETEESYDEDEEDEEEEIHDERAQRRPGQAEPADTLRHLLGDLDQKLEANKKLFEVKAQRRPSMVQREEDRRRMPPPAAPASSQKYSMRTTSKPTRITYGVQRDDDPEDLEDLQDTIRNLGSKATSANRRPSLASGNDRAKAIASSHPAPANSTRATVEHPASGHRTSYHDTESRTQLEQQRQDMEDYIAARAQEGAPHYLQDKLRDITLDHNAISVEDAKMQAAVAYQRQLARDLNKDTDHHQTPLTASALRRKEGLPSDAGSFRSKRSSNDGSGRISAGHRLTGAPSERGGVSILGDEVKMRVDLTSAFETELEGRRLILNPTGDGSIAELVIGSKRETPYYSTNGSTTTASVMNGDTRSRVTKIDRQRDRDVEDDRRSRAATMPSRRQRADAARERGDREDDDGEYGRAAQPRGNRPVAPRPSEARYAPGPHADEYPPSASTYHGYGGQGFPGYPPPGYPPSGYSPSGYPSSGYPPAGYPPGYGTANSSGLYGA